MREEINDRIRIYTIPLNFVVEIDKNKPGKDGEIIKGTVKKYYPTLELALNGTLAAAGTLDQETDMESWLASQEAIRDDLKAFCVANGLGSIKPDSIHSEASVDADDDPVDWLS